MKLKKLIKSYLNSIYSEERDEYTIIKFYNLKQNKRPYLYIYTNDKINDNFLGNELIKFLNDSKIIFHLESKKEAGDKIIIKIFNDENI